MNAGTVVELSAKEVITIIAAHAVAKGLIPPTVKKGDFEYDTDTQQFTFTFRDK